MPRCCYPPFGCPPFDVPGSICFVTQLLYGAFVCAHFVGFAFTFTGFGYVTFAWTYTLHLTFPVFVTPDYTVPRCPTPLRLVYPTLPFATDARYPVTFTPPHTFTHTLYLHWRSPLRLLFWLYGYVYCRLLFTHVERILHTHLHLVTVYTFTHLVTRTFPLCPLHSTPRLLDGFVAAHYVDMFILPCCPVVALLHCPLHLLLLVPGCWTL